MIKIRHTGHGMTDVTCDQLCRTWDIAPPIRVPCIPAPDDLFIGSAPCLQKVWLTKVEREKNIFYRTIWIKIDAPQRRFGKQKNQWCGVRIRIMGDLDRDPRGKIAHNLPNKKCWKLELKEKKFFINKFKIYFLQNYYYEKNHSKRLKANKKLIF